MAAISRDLEGVSNAELIQITQQGKCETEVAMRVFARRLFPQAPDHSIEAVVFGREVLLLKSPQATNMAPLCMCLRANLASHLPTVL